MMRMGGILWFAALLVALTAQVGHAQSNGAAAAAKTIWDGVYTEAQATRGQATAQSRCGSCHSPAEWAHSSFIPSYAGYPIREMHSRIRNSMPFESPGSLTSQEYSDIVAYILKLNRVPAGKTELPSTDAALGGIQVTRPQSR